MNELIDKEATTRRPDRALIEMEQAARRLHKAVNGQVAVAIQLEVKMFGNGCLKWEYLCSAGDVMGKGPAARRIAMGESLPQAEAELLGLIVRHKMADGARLAVLSSIVEEMGYKLVRENKTEAAA